MGPHTRRWAQVCLCVALAAAWYVSPARGQFSRVHTPGVLHTEQAANLFATWEGRMRVDGFDVDLPEGWRLDQARVLRYGYESVPVRLVPSEDRAGRYALLFPEALEGHYELILRVETGDMAGAMQWTLTPFSRSPRTARPERRDAFGVTETLRLDPATRRLDNQALAFAGSGNPLLLRRDGLPDLGTGSPHTVEFWMRTTGLGEVVLSTWDGDEQTAYPLEIVVDAGGRLFCYHGQPGQHLSMMTNEPVADGRWHHVALTHEPATGWTRLFVDGARTDSLFEAVPLRIDLHTALALGGRLPNRREAAPGGAYTGLLDEVRLWPSARTPDEIRRTMNQTLPAPETGVLALDFDRAIPRALIERPSARARRRPSDLDFSHPVRHLHGTFEAPAVVLTWETEDRHTAAFVVERSNDGTYFETVDEVEARDGQVADDAAAFTYRDAAPPGKVVFYRLRQRFDNGTERLSPTLKMGLGAPEAEGDATLIGNYPNPFNPTTTIAYTLRKPQHVRVSVWDLSGQQVALLVDETQSAGYFEVPFEATDLPSGTYFIRLRTAEGVQVRQMILMK